MSWSLKKMFLILSSILMSSRIHSYLNPQVKYDFRHSKVLKFRADYKRAGEYLRWLFVFFPRNLSFVLQAFSPHFIVTWTKVFRDVCESSADMDTLTDKMTKKVELLPLSQYLWLSKRGWARRKGQEMLTPWPWRALLYDMPANDNQILCIHCVWIPVNPKNVHWQVEYRATGKSEYLQSVILSD